MKKLVCEIFFLAVFAAFLSGCGKSGEDKLIEAGFNIDEVNIDVEGLEKNIKIVFINDLHLGINNEEVSDDSSDFMATRISQFSFIGSSSEEKWKILPQMINDCEPDFVALGGDMVDFCSEANVSALGAGIDKLKAPYIYVRSDHDIEPYWLIDTSKETCMMRQNEVADNRRIQFHDLGEAIILGLNYSNNNIDEEALNEIKRIFSMGKPVIIVTHIPVDQEKGTELQKFSEKVRDGRRLYWGIDSEAVPNEYTLEYMNLLYDKDSPVVAVLAAHLHSSFEGKLSENAIEHVFAPCFQGNIGVVNIY